MDIEINDMGIVYVAIRGLSSGTRQKALYSILRSGPEQQHGRCPLSSDIQMCHLIQPDTIKQSVLMLALQA
jgi:hypothetical protein